MTDHDASIRGAGPRDDDTLTALSIEYLTWAIDRLRSEYGVEWPPIDPDAVRTGWTQFRSKGTALIAERAGHPVGIGAVHSLADDVAEVKRMYLREDARGLGIGSQLLDRLLGEAEELGAHVVRLDTIRFMRDAQHLYRSRGFVERAPYEGTEIPEPLQHHWLFFERSLGS